MSIPSQAENTSAAVYRSAVSYRILLCVCGASVVALVLLGFSAGLPGMVLPTVGTLTAFGSLLAIVQTLRFQVAISKSNISVSGLFGPRLRREFSEIEGISADIDGRIVLFFDGWDGMSRITRSWHGVLDNFDLTDRFVKLPLAASKDKALRAYLGAGIRRP